MRILIISAVLFFSSLTSASTIDCQNLHIGRIWVEKGFGLRAVVYLNNRGATSGSYWSYFTGWTSDERKEVLSMLMAAKAMNHRVNVVTENSDGCGMQAGGTVTKTIYLATNP
jgi:hypothetical protein